MQRTSKKFGIANLPKQYQRYFPKIIIDLLNHPACIVIGSNDSFVNFDVVPGQYVIFQAYNKATKSNSIKDNTVQTVLHELCHFANINEKRCGIADFGFKWDEFQHAYILPKKRFPDVIQETQVLARERNVASFIQTKEKGILQEIDALYSLPSIRNRQCKKSDLELAKLITDFQNLPEYSAEITLQKIQHRLDLLAAEPWRIQKSIS